jgi:hypothetical protein
MSFTQLGKPYGMTGQGHYVAAQDLAVDQVIWVEFPNGVPSRWELVLRVAPVMVNGEVTAETWLITDQCAYVVPSTRTYLV